MYKRWGVFNKLSESFFITEDKNNPTYLIGIWLNEEFESIITLGYITYNENMVIQGLEEQYRME